MSEKYVCVRVQTRVGQPLIFQLVNHSGCLCGCNFFLNRPRGQKKIKKFSFSLRLFYLKCHIVHPWQQKFLSFKRWHSEVHKKGHRLFLRAQLMVFWRFNLGSYIILVQNWILIDYVQRDLCKTNVGMISSLLKGDVSKTFCCILLLGEPCYKKTVKNLTGSPFRDPPPPH